MKLLVLGNIMFIMSGILAASAFNMAIGQSQEALQYKRAYEATRGEIEALYRTIGKGVDPAYVCKTRH